MCDNEGVMVLEEMNDDDFGGAGSDEEPFIGDIAVVLSSVSSVVGNSTVASILEISHSDSFDLNYSEEHMRS